MLTRTRHMIACPSHQGTKRQQLEIKICDHTQTRWTYTHRIESKDICHE